MRSLIIILIIAAVLAYFTVPGQDKFNKFLEKKGKNTGTCLNGKRHTSYKIFTIEYVDYCEPAVNMKPVLSPGLVKTRTDKYLGIFGRFIKL